MRNLDSDVDKLKKLMEEVSEAVKEIPEKFQQDAFKIILTHLLKGKTTSTISPQPLQEGNENDQKLVRLDILANTCKINRDELKNVISISENNVEVVCQIKGIESHRLVVGSLILLLSHEILFNSEWIKSSIIIDSLKKIGTQDKGGNFAKYLTNHSDLFLKHSNLMEYRLTTNNGRIIASRAISKLSKGELITKNDLKLS